MSEKSEKAGRLRCCVPFCQRTTGEPFAEWICAKHWPATSRETRARYAKLRATLRKGRRRGRDLPHTRRAANALREKLKIEAIERAAGI